jgi:hypothetical protein
VAVEEHAHIGVDLGTEYRISNLETVAQKHVLVSEGLKELVDRLVARVNALEGELFSVRTGIRNLNSRIEQHERRSHGDNP